MDTWSNWIAIEHKKSLISHTLPHLNILPDKQKLYVLQSAPLDSFHYFLHRCYSSSAHHSSFTLVLRAIPFVREWPFDHRNHSGRAASLLRDVSSVCSFSSTTLGNNRVTLDVLGGKVTNLARYRISCDRLRDFSTHSDRAALGCSCCRIGARSSGARTRAVGRASAQICQGRRSRDVS